MEGGHILVIRKWVESYVIMKGGHIVTKRV